MIQRYEAKDHAWWWSGKGEFKWPVISRSHECARNVFYTPAEWGKPACSNKPVEFVAVKVETFSNLRSMCQSCIEEFESKGLIVRNPKRRSDKFNATK